jgi:NADH-quinone oxidoreductase subunit L
VSWRWSAAGAAWLEHWLEPVTDAGSAYWAEIHLEVATEWLLLGGATVIAVVGMLGAWFMLKPERLEPAAAATDESGFQRVLKDKYYIDELYDAIFVRPLVWLSRRVLWKSVDDGVIDGVAVNGSAKLSQFAGWIGTRFQTGRVGTYILAFVIGALVLIRAVMR